MNRDDFFNMAKKYGWGEGRPLVGEGKLALKRELLAYFNSDAGREELTSGPLWHREELIETIVDALLSEVD